MYRCPCCQQSSPKTQVDIASVQSAINADPLTQQDTFKRTYIGHGTQSSVFVFQGHRGPFRKHIHVTHDEIGYVLDGQGTVTVGGITREVRPGDIWIIPANTPHAAQFDSDRVQVLFMSSPMDDPAHPDRVWLD